MQSDLVQDIRLPQIREILPFSVADAEDLLYRLRRPGFEFKFIFKLLIFRMIVPFESFDLLEAQSRPVQIHFREPIATVVFYQTIL